ncbi:tyrosine-type recombinase/integrase [Streptomyces sp. NPDC056817]|uniref:tyrosine-type recombinase/integrase n=1 Tax=Streptomyces sp. NPDC056817 TaxID=3345950 RepID=UPI00369322C6
MSDGQWDELLAQMRCARDRARLSCYVASGARAYELLGIELGDIDWTRGQIWVLSKGTRARQPVPVSPEALAYLAAYLDEAGLPEPGVAVWRTRRGESRPLTYWAARRIIQRATEALGVNWTLHDLRHTAATAVTHPEFTVTPWSPQQTEAYQTAWQTWRNLAWYIQAALLRARRGGGQTPLRR